MQLPINKIKVEKRFRHESGDLESLKASITKLGLLNPVVVSEDHQLICGFRRLQACKELGLPVEARVVNIENWIEAEHDENVERKDFTLDEKISIMEAIKERIGERRGGDVIHNTNRSNDLAKCIHGNTLLQEKPYPGHKTRDFAAKKAGLTSASSANEIKIILAKGCPELIEAVEKKVIGSRTAYWLCHLAREEQAQIVLQGKKEVMHRSKLARREHALKRNYMKTGKKLSKNIKKEREQALKSEPRLIEKQAEAKFRAFWARTIAVYAQSIGPKRLLNIYIVYLQTLSKAL